MQIRLYAVFLLTLVLSIPEIGDCSGFPVNSDLSVAFDGGYGQLEVGGKYVGLEFHQSRPLPSRISFYYPVANSLDLSTGYWERAESCPITAFLDAGGVTDTLAEKSWTYQYAPHRVTFARETPLYKMSIEYEVCDDFPAVEIQYECVNLSGERKEFRLTTRNHTMLRTSHTYAPTLPDSVWYEPAGEILLSSYNGEVSGPAVMFHLNMGNPVDSYITSMSDVTVDTVYSTPVQECAYQEILHSGDTLRVTQIIGTARPDEIPGLLRKIPSDWERSVLEYDEWVREYAHTTGIPAIQDTALRESYLWAKMMLAANRHYLGGNILPMPCPAEYNFFFTHDALVTDLARVFFDTERVKKDLLFLKNLAAPDSLLPHAYYWKDGEYRIEWCGADNWNHAWLIILGGSYLRHSGDVKTMRMMLPLMRNSLRLLLEQKRPDNLMNSRLPDWWDFGNRTGARTYLTSLTILALREFGYICTRLDEFPPAFLPESYRVADRMNSALVRDLWDDDRGYLMNMLDSATVDTHYYAGSLVASAFGLLPDSLNKELLGTAEEQLLDTLLGIRNAMPPDFHRLAKVYRYNPGEPGEPYRYMNGGVWGHITAWYLLGLLQNGEVHDAVHGLRRFLTIDGIAGSPGGQPAMYEYRFSDPDSPEYGRIDKPAFLWTAGWYLYTLYGVMGVEGSSWNVALRPEVSGIMGDLEHSLMWNGRLCHIRYSGQGEFAGGIQVDGKPGYSLVLTDSVSEIVVNRGEPALPYLESANCLVHAVNWSDSTRMLEVRLGGLDGQEVELRIVSPMKVRAIPENPDWIMKEEGAGHTPNIIRYRLSGKLTSGDEVVVISFE